MFAFSWCKTHDYDDAIKDLFLTSLTPDYISHSEIQEGRAININQWHSNLKGNIQSDINNAVSDKHPHYAMAVALQENKFMGVAFVSETQAAIHYATLDDLMISTQARGMGLGGKFLDWIEKEIKNKGINHLFLESGIRNHGAHHFFEKHQFIPVSVTMLKKL